MKTEPQYVAVVSRTHVCPYLQQSRMLAQCYQAANNMRDEYCYGCPEVPRLQELYGLRCYKRVKTTQKVEGFTWLYFPANTECTRWVVVHSVTGERRSITKHVFEKMRDNPSHKAFYADQLRPLEGAPGCGSNRVPSEASLEAAAKAAMLRGPAR